MAGGEEGGREEAAVAVFGASIAEQGHINPTTSQHFSMDPDLSYRYIEVTS